MGRLLIRLNMWLSLKSFFSKFPAMFQNAIKMRRHLQAKNYEMRKNGSDFSSCRPRLW